MISKKVLKGKNATLPRRSELTKDFRKDWKGLQHGGTNLASLKEVVILLIANEGPLGPEAWTAPHGRGRFNPSHGPETHAIRFRPHPWEKKMNKKSIWAVVAGVLFIIIVTTLVDVVLHVAGTRSRWSSSRFRSAGWAARSTRCGRRR